MNEARFSGLAAVYAAHRPAYADALLAHLFQPGLLPDAPVLADIGAGTGKLTAQLLSRGAQVFAVEPNPDMRGQAEQTLGDTPGFTSVPGSAEETNLPDGNVDGITVAQAFHWLDPIRFGTECRRILRPNGRVFIIYNHRVSDIPLVQENEALNRAFCPDFKGFSLGAEARTDAPYDSFFRDGAFETVSFPNPQRYDLEGFLGRNLSSSYAPRESDSAYAPYIAALTELFHRHAQDGLADLPYRTHCYYGFV